MASTWSQSYLGVNRRSCPDHSIRLSQLYGRQYAGRKKRVHSCWPWVSQNPILWTMSSGTSCRSTSRAPFRSQTVCTQRIFKGYWLPIAQIPMADDDNSSMFWARLHSFVLLMREAIKCNAPRFRDRTMISPVALHPCRQFPAAFPVASGKQEVRIARPQGGQAKCSLDQGRGRTGSFRRSCSTSSILSLIARSFWLSPRISNSARRLTSKSNSPRVRSLVSWRF